MKTKLHTECIISFSMLLLMSSTSFYSKAFLGYTLCPTTNLRKIAEYSSIGEQQLNQLSSKNSLLSHQLGHTQFINSALSIFSIMLIAGLVMSHQATITRSYRKVTMPFRSITRKLRLNTNIKSSSANDE